MDRHAHGSNVPGSRCPIMGVANVYLGLGTGMVVQNPPETTAKPLEPKKSDNK